MSNENILMAALNYVWTSTGMPYPSLLFPVPSHRCNGSYGDALMKMVSIW